MKPEKKSEKLEKTKYKIGVKTKKRTLIFKAPFLYYSHINFYPCNASAPLTISSISFVIAA
jgi:hypothetical protein